MKNPLKHPTLEWKKKVTWSDPPLVVKKTVTWNDPPPPIGGRNILKKIPPIGGGKRSLELIPIGVKWPTIINEKKVVWVIPLNTKKIHLSDFTSTSCEKTFLLKGPDLLRNFICHMNWPHWLEKKKFTWFDPLTYFLIGNILCSVGHLNPHSLLPLVKLSQCILMNHFISSTILCIF